MGKRVIGMVLTILGIAGLVMAGYFFMNTGKNSHAGKNIAMYGILGIVFFSAGISLLKNTTDKPT